MSARILLVNPPYDIERYMGSLGKIGWVFPPIGLLYIASFLKSKKPSYDVRIFDFQVEDRDFFESLRGFKPDIIGITCQTALVYSALTLSEDIKKVLPGVKIIAGGVHPSIRPDDLLKSKDIDIVVRGEGEEAFFEICEAAELKAPFSQIKGISYKDASGKIIHSPKRPINPNIDTYPMPAINLVPIEKYRISPDLRTGDRFGLILTSRGCPYDCIFCANKLLTERTYRMRSIKNVIEEVEYYINNHGVNQLMIIDDNFTVNKKRTIELCDEFIRRGYPRKLNWWAEARVDSLDEELLAKMKEAGCSILSLGIESGNQRLLDLINKGIAIKDIERAVRLIKKSGIKSRASIILGLPTETKEESRNTVKFAYSLPIDQVRFSIATPFPGTKLWEIAVKEGKINPESIDWRHLSLMGGYAEHLPPYYPDGRTPEEIKRLQKRANFYFYLRPRIVFGFMKRVKSWDDLKHMLKGALHFTKASRR